MLDCECPATALIELHDGQHVHKAGGVPKWYWRDGKVQRVILSLSKSPALIYNPHFTVYVVTFQSCVRALRESIMLLCTYLPL